MTLGRMANVATAAESCTAQPYKRFMVLCWKAGRSEAGIARNLGASFDTLEDATAFIGRMRSGYAHRVDSFEILDRVDGVVVE